MVASGEDANLDADGRREDLLDTREELQPIGIDVVADADVAHARVLTDFHGVESRAIRARSSSCSSRKPGSSSNINASSTSEIAASAPTSYSTCSNSWA